MLYSQSAGKLNIDSPSIVLVHGLFGSGDNLAVIRRHFERDHHVLSVDLPDHGRSPRFDEWSFEVAAQRLIQTIQGAGIHQCYLVGHSLGGKVSMLAAHLAPSLVQKLVVLDIAPVAYKPRHDAVLSGLNSVVLGQLKTRKQASEQLSQHINDAGTISFLLKSLFQDDNAKWQWRFNLKLIERDYNKIIDWPLNLVDGGVDRVDVLFSGHTTFIKGANSDYITREHQTAIMQQFPNAKAKIVAAGHWLHAEKTQLVNTLLTRVLLE